MKINKSAEVCFGIFFIFFIMTVGSAASISTQRVDDQLILTETQLTTNESHQGSTLIYGDRIVWEDKRNGNYDIYMYDVSTSTEIRITDNASDQIGPVIYGDRILWYDARNGNGDIYMYDLSTSTETPVIVNQWEQGGPMIFEDRIVFQDSRNGNLDIYMYNLSTSTETRITTDKSDQFDPVIYGDRIVWTDSRNGYDTYMYDLSTRKETKISNESRIVNSGRSNIYADRVVWTGEDSTGLIDIYMYNISTSRETRITTGGYSSGWSPNIYGDRIVWMDGRSGNEDIYMYDLSTSKETRITTDESFQGWPAIYGDRIVWSDGRNGNQDIYMCTISVEDSTPEPPLASFFVSDYGGYTPLKVGFTFDYISDGLPTAWSWDFGDGASSTDQDPVHTFSKEGIYTVTLTVSNKAGTDTTTREINVKTPSVILTKTQITTSGTAQSPAIYGDRIVWQDERNGNSDIYMYNVSTSTETRITDNESNQRNPKIYGDKIAWEDDRNGGSFDDGENPIRNWDIYIYDLSTSKESQITTNNSTQGDPAIYGDKIVWVDRRNDNGNPDDGYTVDIYMYDLSTSKETQITTTGSAYSPAIYGDKIVWEDWREGCNIYMYNLSTSTETMIITNDPYQMYWDPAIYGDRIVFEVNPGLVDLYLSIHLYNLSTSKETGININGVNNENPAIYGDRIIGISHRGYDSYEHGYVYMYDLSTSSETQISINQAEGNPAIYGDRIVWEERSNVYSNSDIYMCTVSAKEPALKPPVANFSATPTSGKAPLKVKFTSTSTGSPTLWKWNFGDGSPLVMGQNPVHTYSKAGIYTVKHTAGNAAGKDTEIKTNYINVVSASPKAAFSASPTSGYAPLKVTFTDKSTGSPTSWKWSFGDGTYSTSKSPVHTYGKAGKYTVSLTAKNAAGSSTVTKLGYVVVNTLKAPVAAFSAAPSSGKVPLKVQFADKSSGTPTSWKWSFGDGTYSTQKNPSHTYNKVGKYTVALKAKNAKGSSTKTMSGYIIVSKK